MIVKTKLLCTIMALVMTSACQHSPETQLNAQPSSGLHDIANSMFKRLELTHPHSISQYKAIYFAPIDLSQLEVDTRKLDKAHKNWLVSDDEKAKIQNIFAASVTSSLGMEGLSLAPAPGENVLTVALSLTKFTPTAPKDDIISRMGLPDIYTFSVGDLDLAGEFRDSQSGALIGNIEDSKKIGNSIDLEKNDNINNSRKLKNTFDKWLSEITETLNKESAR